MAASTLKNPIFQDETKAREWLEGQRWAGGVICPFCGQVGNAKAQPATGLTLSLCMIVRDEEAMLTRTLAAAREAVDEIVVVDTGSRDRTQAMRYAYDHGYADPPGPTGPGPDSRW